jgi:long-chain acyl-CoA synthetase
MNVTPTADAPPGHAAPPGTPWLAHPAAVPSTIDEGRLGTLADIFRTSVAEYASRPALESFGTRMSFAELGAAAAAVASWLQAQGLAKGDRVAIMLPNVMA